MRAVAKTCKQLGVHELVSKSLAVSAAREAVGLDFSRLLPVPKKERIPFPPELLVEPGDEEWYHHVLDSGLYIQDSAGYPIRMEKLSIGKLIAGGAK
jgi:hypothetical protein